MSLETLIRQDGKRSERERAQRDARRQEEIDGLLASFDARPQESLEGLLRHGVLVSEDRVEHAFPRLEARARRALLRGEALIHRGRLIPVVRGAGYGVGDGATWRNAPEGVQGKDWNIDPETFYVLTNRNEQIVPAPSKASGWDVASPLDFPHPKVGVLHEQALVLTGTMTITLNGGSFTQGWKWPWGVFGAIAIQAGGENALQYGTGVDFRTRIERLYRNPMTGSVAGAGAGTSGGTGGTTGSAASGTLQAGANSIKVILKIPIAHDLRTGMGAVYRQSDDLQLVTHIAQPDMTQLIALAGGATAVWSNVNVQLVETYMTPERDSKGMIALPDVSRVFMTTVDEEFFSNNGPVKVSIQRRPGTLLCMTHTLDQGTTVIAPSSLSEIRFKYGANKQPITLIPDRILEINRRNYDGPLQNGNVYALDGEVDNPMRDVWIPANFTEGKVEVVVPNTITPAANSRTHLFSEYLVQARLN